MLVEFALSKKMSTTCEEPKPEVEEVATQTENGEKKTSKKKVNKGTGVKRGFGRPFARLEQKVLDNRMKKLKLRIDRSRTTLEKAEKYYAKYVREAGLREKDADTTTTTTSTEETDKEMQKPE